MTSDPKRLTVVGATDLERTLLQAARNERPSPELTARMAAGLGISVGAAVTTAAAPAAAAKATTVSALTGWVSAGVLAVAVTAGVVGVRQVNVPVSHAPDPRPAKAAVAAPVAPAIEPAVAEMPHASSVAAPETRVEKVRRRPAATALAAPAPASDLRDQIALIDAARGAVKAGSSDRALVLLRRYETSYRDGAFQPEALALRIEALEQDGRHAEGRALARDFLARYPRSPVADRVARVVQK